MAFIVTCSEERFSGWCRGPFEDRETAEIVAAAFGLSRYCRDEHQVLEVRETADHFLMMGLKLTAFSMAYQAVCGEKPDDNVVWGLQNAWAEDDKLLEYRIGGKLGFGGKFRAAKQWPNLWPHWYVDYYPEDENPERRELVARVNRDLATLLDSPAARKIIQKEMDSWNEGSGS